ncbi:MAG: hypothetical protein K6G07_00745 [Lachnospiraceae bacterium]|nr:hypothetical protein [Lachnospiraceae bacterium]
MPAIDIAKNALATSTGSVVKAKIKILDERKLTEGQLKKLEMDVQKKEKGLDDLINIDELPVDVEDMVSNVAGSMASTVQTATSGIGQSIMNGINSLIDGGFSTDMYNRVIEVQFNPNSLRISSNASDEDVEVLSFTQNGSQMGRGSADLHIDLSFRLIFDQISNTGAFEQDNLTLSSSRIINSGLGALESVTFGRNTQSVQVTVEAFIAMLRNPMTRRICFEWGEFKYEGIVTTVNANYTMFDINGNPIRAEVGLTMYLVDPDITSKVSNKGYWSDAYERAFVRGNAQVEAMMQMAQLGHM